MAAIQAPSMFDLYPIYVHPAHLTGSDDGGDDEAAAGAFEALSLDRRDSASTVTTDEEDYTSDDDSLFDRASTSRASSVSSLWTPDAASTPSSTWGSFCDDGECNDDDADTTVQEAESCTMDERQKSNASTGSSSSTVTVSASERELERAIRFQRAVSSPELPSLLASAPGLSRAYTTVSGTDLLLTPRAARSSPTPQVGGKLDGRTSFVSNKLASTAMLPTPSYDGGAGMVRSISSPVATEREFSRRRSELSTLSATLDRQLSTDGSEVVPPPPKRPALMRDRSTTRPPSPPGAVAPHMRPLPTNFRLTQGWGSSLPPRSFEHGEGTSSAPSPPPYPYNLVAPTKANGSLSPSNPSPRNMLMRSLSMGEVERPREGSPEKSATGGRGLNPAFETYGTEDQHLQMGTGKRRAAGAAISVIIPSEEQQPAPQPRGTRSRGLSTLCAMTPITPPLPSASPSESAATPTQGSLLAPSPLSTCDPIMPDPMLDQDDHEDRLHGGDGESTPVSSPRPALLRGVSTGSIPLRV